MGQDEQDPGLRAVESLYKLMRIDEEWSVRRPRGFTWWAYRLAQHVEAGEPFPMSTDGPTASLIRIWTDVVTEVPAEAAADALNCAATANLTETMSALVFDSLVGSLIECCTMVVTNETNEQWLKVLSVAAVMQNTAAHSRADSVAIAVAGKPAQSAHPTSGERPEMDGLLNYVAEMLLPSAPKESAFAGALMQSLADANLPFWTLATSDADWFTGEIPYSGNVPAVAHKAGSPLETALFQVLTADSHPELGSGALIVLSLPNRVGENARSVANSLNLLESSGQSINHQLGAWCEIPPGVYPLQSVYQGVSDHKSRTGSLAFVTFVPSQLAWGNVLQHLAFSDFVRTRWAFAQFNRQEVATKGDSMPLRDGVPYQRVESVTQQADLEWSRFSHSLAACLGQLKVDQFLILDSHGYYVQFAQHGPRGLLAESVSNNFLEDFELLSPDGEKRLKELGWVEPGKDAGDRQGPSNWSKEWLQPVPYPAVADLATQTLRSVYGVSAPTDLVYKASDRSGAAVLLPNLGVRRSELAKPVAPDTPKKQQISDLIGPTDVAWNLWENSTEPIGQDNVGRNLWNVSNQISFVRNLAVRARERLDEGHSMEQWPAEEVAEFTRLTEAAEQAAQRATNLWEQLRAIVASTDRTLVEPLEQGVSVIHNHGRNPELMARVGAAWKTDTSRNDAQVISDKLEALLAQHGLPAIEAFRRLKQPVANDEPSPSGTQTNQTGSTGQAMEAPPTSRSSTNLPACPSCGAHEVVPVIYGIPDPALLPIFDSGAIRPGGAFGRLADHTGPHWYCRGCGGAWRGDLFQGSGDSPDDPVVISGITDHAVFIRAEKMFLVERFGLSADEAKEGSSGWRLSQQALLRGKTGPLDLLTVVLASGEQRGLFFQLPR